MLLDQVEKDAGAFAIGDGRQMLQGESTGQHFAAFILQTVFFFLARAIQLYLEYKNIQHTVRYTELAAGRFKDFWKD